MPSKEISTAALFAVGPGIDSTDGASLEEAIAHNATGMDAILFEETQAGLTATALTPTTGGSQDWTHVDGGNYSLEITAAQLDTEGGAWVQVKVDGVLVMVSPYYEVIDPTDADLLTLFLSILDQATGQLDSGSFAANAIAAAAVASDVGTEIAAAVQAAQHPASGQAQSGTNNTIELAVGDGALVSAGMVIVITAGTGAGQRPNVIASVSTDTATMVSNWETNPDSTSRYAVLDVE